MIDFLMALPALIQAGSGIAELFGASNVPKEYQDYYDELQRRLKEGLSPAEESRLISGGAQQAARMATTAQNRGAAALASRGMSNSSVADTMLSDVNSMQAKMLTDIFNNVMALDEQAKQSAVAPLGAMTETMVNRGDVLSSAGWGELGSGLGGLMNAFKKPKRTFLDWLDENKDLFQSNNVDWQNLFMLEGMMG